MSEEKKKNELVPYSPKGESRLAKFVDGLTVADLEDLREEISATENRLKGMKKLEGVVATSLGKESAKKKYKHRESGKVDAETYLIEKRRKVAAFLLEHCPRTGHDIIVKCGIQPAKLAEVMLHPWFSKSDGGYHVTPQCRRDLG
jgi:hypothetical protein